MADRTVRWLCADGMGGANRRRAAVAECRRAVSADHFGCGRSDFLQWCAERSRYALIPGTSPGLSGYYGSASRQRSSGFLSTVAHLRSGISLVQDSSAVMSQPSAAKPDSGRGTKRIAGACKRFPDHRHRSGQFKQVAQIIQARSALGLQRQIFFARWEGLIRTARNCPTQRPLSQLDPALVRVLQRDRELGMGQQVTSFTCPISAALSSPAPMAARSRLGQPSHGGGRRGSGRRSLRHFPTLALGGPDDVGTTGAGFRLPRWINTAPRWPNGSAYRRRICR